MQLTDKEFEKFKKDFDLCRKHLALYAKYHRKVHYTLLEKYGFLYNDTDDDEMIDTIEYGTQSITAEGFISKMEKYRDNGWGINE